MKVNIRVSEFIAVGQSAPARQAVTAAEEAVWQPVRELCEEETG